MAYLGLCYVTKYYHVKLFISIIRIPITSLSSSPSSHVPVDQSCIKKVLNCHILICNTAKYMLWFSSLKNKIKSKWLFMGSWKKKNLVNYDHYNLINVKSKTFS